MGLKPLSMDERSLVVPTSWRNVEMVLVRPEDIGYVVESGAALLGITGRDLIIEGGAEVEELVPLDFGVGKIVLAVPESWRFSTPEELARGGREIRIATKYYNVAREYAARKGLKARIIKVSGATEVMPYLGAADAVIDVMSTGTTLKIHGLKPIDTVMETRAVLVAYRGWRESSESGVVRRLVTLVKGVVEGRGRKLLFMNVPEESLRAVLKVLPAMLAPAVTKLSESGAWEVITVVDEGELSEVVAQALEAGARDIVVVDIEKVIKG